MNKITKALIEAAQTKEKYDNLLQELNDEVFGKFALPLPGAALLTRIREIKARSGERADQLTKVKGELRELSTELNTSRLAVRKHKDAFAAADETTTNQGKIIDEQRDELADLQLKLRMTEPKTKYFLKLADYPERIISAHFYEEETRSFFNHGDDVPVFVIGCVEITYLRREEQS